VKHLARARSENSQKQETRERESFSKWTYEGVSNQEKYLSDKEFRSFSGSSGVSLMEIIAMLTILGIAIVAMFSTVTGGIFFAKDSENRIKAINLAREWLEGVTDMRNTNWLRFSSDQANCWKVKDYNASCIGDSAWINAPYIGTNNYILLNKNGAWYLTGTTSGSGLWVGSDGYYTASGSMSDPLCTLDIRTNCRSVFTREIRISIPGWNTGSMTVTSVVDWRERSPQNVTLTTTLTNWKSKF
jgi:type II secretory pathway pseudopilin PulG